MSKRLDRLLATTAPPYKPDPKYWDEALLRPGFPRRHWRKLTLALQRMDLEQLNRRWKAGQHLIRANGIAYNVYGDPKGMERPWVMDPLPLVIDSRDWSHIEAGIAQRVTLLNAILADLYGPRLLIHRRALPAALLFANPYFLRACSGILPPRGIHLHLYAADLARSPDGRWRVISDRTQAPSGIGYALENRMVSARTLPAVFNQCSVRPLARFFEVRRDALMALAPGGRSNPRIVLLTPGPNNETYVEHSLLAHHWSIPLVEGADLTVRDNRVFLKALAGLDPVDLVVRRLDDTYCDPLELRGDSLLGVPGLVEAVRSGNVVLVNALGTGLLESSAFMAFLPGLCREILGEELRMPSLATWWCGQEGPRRYVLDHLDDLVILPAFPEAGQNPVFPESLSEQQRSELVARIAAAPECYVAQEKIAPSTAPVHTSTGPVARHIVLRVFAGWDGESFTVMPGGLTRVAIDARLPVVSMQMGGGSKDTWVLAETEEHGMAHRAAQIKVDEPRSAGELPSRVAENLFWMGRYSERVEAAVRLVRALLPGLSGEEDYGRTASLESATHLLIELEYLPPELRAASLQQRRRLVENLLTSVVYDPAGVSGIGWNLKHLRRVTWQVKERLSHDAWRVLQQLEEAFSAPAPSNPEARLMAVTNLVDRAVVILSAFAGLLAESTTRAFGWRFLEVGKRLERALQICMLLRTALTHAPFEVEPLLVALLHIADSSITYRTRYFSALHPEYVLELLVADGTNPRSLSFQLAALSEHLDTLPRGSASESPDSPNVLAREALDRVRNTTGEDLAARDADGNLTALEQLLNGLVRNLHDLADAISARHFSHLAARQLVPS